MFLGFGEACTSSITASGAVSFLPYQTPSETSQWLLDLEFPVIFTVHPPLADVWANSAESPAAKASSHMFTVYHQCIGPILLVWGKIRTGHKLPSHDRWWGYAGNLGESLEKSIIVPLTWRQIALLTQWPGIFWKKSFAKAITAQGTPRIMAKVSKMVAMLGTAAWMGPYSV